MIHKKFFNLILPINLLFDLLLIFEAYSNVLAIIRAVLLIYSLLEFLVIKKISLLKYKLLLLFIFYCFILIPFSSSLEVSINMTLKICIPILYFIVGFEYFQTSERINKLVKSITIFYFLLVLNFIVSNYFNIGVDAYSDSSDFLVGNLDDRWNVFTYSLLVLPLVLLYCEKSSYKNLNILLAFICTIILILSIKRIAILSLVFGGIIYFYFNFSFKRILFFSFTSLILLLISFTLVSDLFESRLANRSDRFEDGAMQKEARYMESIYVWQETFSFKRIDKSIFGLQAFNSVGNYADGYFGERNIHVDYNLILNTNGLLGLVLYFLCLSGIYFKFRKSTKFLNHNTDYINTFIGIFYALFITQFVTSFGGQMYNITFRLLIFIFLGAISGHLNFISSKYFRESSNSL